MITVETIGQKLQAARGKRKLSLEDASRATKIRSRQLADLERDEYSNFPNLAYAKGFLISYGKYLDVDVRPYLRAFEDSNSFGLDNYQYLSDIPLGVYRATRRPTRRRTGRKRYAVLAGALGAITLGFFCWQLYVSYQRLGDLDKLAEHQAAQERGGDAALAPPATPASAVAPTATDSAARSTGSEDPAGAAPPPPDFPHNPGTSSSTHSGRFPALPLPDDGGALRRLLPEAGEPEGPWLISNDTTLPSPAAGNVERGRGSWSPENLEGYRFYVRSLNRYSVEIFRTGVPRPETVLNNRL